MLRALLLTATLLMALAPTAAADAATDAVSSFAFVASPDHAGPIVVGMTFDFGSANWCEFRTQASGTNQVPPVLSAEEENGRLSSFYSTLAGHVHAPVAGQTVDTRDVRDRSGGVWSLTMTTTGPFSGVSDYTHIVFDAGSWENEATGYHAPLLIQVACSVPFTVTDFRQGHEAVGFTGDSLRGGTGVTASPLVGSVALIDDAGVAADFTHDLVKLRATVRSGNSMVEGELRVTTPDGAHAFPLTGNDNVALAGGSGAYALSLDYRAIGQFDRFLGLMYAADPVPALTP